MNYLTMFFAAQVFFLGGREGGMRQFIKCCTRCLVRSDQVPFRSGTINNLTFMARNYLVFITHLSLALSLSLFLYLVLALNFKRADKFNCGPFSLPLRSSATPLKSLQFACSSHCVLGSILQVRSRYWKQTDSWQIAVQATTLVHPPPSFHTLLEGVRQGCTPDLADTRKTSIKIAFSAQ